MKRYEYKKIQNKHIGVIVDLKLLGQDGWELCRITDLCWILKREISSQDVHIGFLVSCAYARGVGNLQHRTIAEFAQFVEDVMDGKFPKYEFDWNRRDAIEIWIEKFHEYCKELYDGIMKQMLDDELNNQKIGANL